MSEDKTIQQETWLPAHFVAAHGLLSIGGKELPPETVFPLIEIMQHMYSNRLDKDRLALYNKVCVAVLESDRIIRNMMSVKDDEGKI